MAQLVQISFPYRGPFGSQMAEALKDLAQSISQETGLIWKIWTENRETQTAGGIYLFESGELARAYLQKHTARLQALGITDISAAVFDINIELTRITRGPVD
jgi:hypothetical protein